MDAEEIDLWADALLLKIHAITGWTIPEKTILTVFTDQFKKKIIESYPRCNPEEIEYAFRSGGTTVKDWGKQINLSLIDEVMKPYLHTRYELSRIEEQQKVKQLEPAKEDLSEKTMSEWWNSIAEQIRKSEYKLEFIPIMLYDWKEKQAGFTAAMKRDYLVKAVDYRHQLLVNSDGKKDLVEFNRMKTAGCFEGSEIQALKDLAKRMIIFDWMKNE